MPTRKPKDDDDDQEQRPREPHKEEHEAVKIHEAYLEHRLGGGAPATPEAYRRAVEQFEKLPGAMRSTPPPEPEKKPEPKGEKGADQGEQR